MNGHSSINSANESFLTQAEKIESLLRSRYGQWIPAYELADIALQYCARINSIRRKFKRAGDQERVENKTEWVKGQCHGSYRIVRAVDADSQEKPPAPPEPKPVEPGQDWYKVQTGRERPKSHAFARPFSPRRMTQDDCRQVKSPTLFDTAGR
jgi:hypothetical protein